jgi:hypothetical protein
MKNNKILSEFRRLSGLQLLNESENNKYIGEYSVIDTVKKEGPYGQYLFTTLKDNDGNKIITFLSTSFEGVKKINIINYKDVGTIKIGGDKLPLLKGVKLKDSVNKRRESKTKEIVFYLNKNHDLYKKYRNFIDQKEFDTYYLIPRLREAKHGVNKITVNYSTYGTIKDGRLPMGLPSGIHSYITTNKNDFYKYTEQFVGYFTIEGITENTNNLNNLKAAKQTFLDMKLKIKQLFKEAIEEAIDTKHSLDRVTDRILKMSDVDMDVSTKDRILNNLETVKLTNFPKHQSFMVLLGGFKINPESELHTKVKSRDYYRIMIDNRDSTGDQLWAIIRNNSVVTVMLRKKIQSTDVEYMKDKNRVDNVIFNIDRYLKNKK